MRNQIIIGGEGSSQQVFDQNRIRNLSGTLAGTISGSEMIYDELCVTLDVSDYMPEDGSPFAPWPYGTQIVYKHNGGDFGGMFYITNPRRVGKCLWELVAVSGIGLLDKQYHVGGMYYGQTFGAVAAEIIGDAIPYSVFTDVKDIPVYGWLPYQSKRANLHQLLFAVGASVTRNPDFRIAFRFLYDGTGVRIEDRRLYQGGSIDYPDHANCVDVTEHSFFALDGDQLETLFDNTDGNSASGQTTVVFQNAPIHSLSTTGTLSIVESNCNYAIVEGVGTLTGKLYTHATRIVSQSKDVAPAEPKTVSVKDAYLVSLANSRNVAKRLLAYHSTVYSINVDIVWKDERPCDVVRFTNPFDELTKAYIGAMDFVGSTTLKASCEMIAGYIPQALGNNYENVAILVGTGVWTPPEGVTEATVVIVGGGSGGSNGLPGKAGSDGTGKENGLGGAGGSAGSGGSGGKVLTVNMTFNGSEISYSCGIGGNGARASDQSNAGEEGTATTFGQYSSDNGTRNPSGVANLFTGELFGGDGSGGVAGGNGSQSDAVYVLNGTKVLDGGKRGDSVYFDGQTFEPGADGKSANYAFNGAGGGGGGGAAIAQNGEPGKSGTAINLDDPNVGADSEMYTFGGYGGNGANATVPGADAQSLGKGGGGGHGGGGGGGGGGAGYYYSGYGTFTAGKGGDPGQGSDGGKGGDGVILIYY